MVRLTVTPLVRMFDEILDPSIRLRVAGLLVSFPEKEFTGREIARLLGVSHSNVQRALRVLVDDGLVSKKRIGKADVFWTNQDHFAFKALRELFQARRELPERIAKDLRAAFRESGTSAIVFGSYARGDADRDSDLDVLVIAKDRSALEDKITRTEADFARKYGIRLSVKVVSPSDLAQRHVPPYIQAAAREGVLLWGEPVREGIDPAG